MARRPVNSRLPIWKPVAEGERVHDESLLLEEIVSHLQHHGTFRRLAAWPFEFSLNRMSPITAGPGELKESA
jgi:hypothetical protein